MRVPTSKPFFLAYLLVLVGVSACGTTRRGPEATTDSATTLRAEYETLRTQVETTIQSLDEVMAPVDDDQATAYGKFVTAVQDLESQGQRVENASARMKSASETYIQNWSAQMAEIQNEEIRRLSEERRAEAEEKITIANDGLAEARANYDQLQSYLRDIQLVLSQDLNQAGVDALGDVIASAKDRSATVLGEIDEVIVALDQTIATFSALRTSEAAADR